MCKHVVKSKSLIYTGYMKLRVPKFIFNYIFNLTSVKLSIVSKQKKTALSKNCRLSNSFSHLANTKMTSYKLHICQVCVLRQYSKLRLFHKRVFNEITKMPLLKFAQKFWQ